MYSAISPAEMRQVVVNRFQQHDSRAMADGELEERVRVESGKVVAYCYRAGNLFAMWMIEIGLVQFYDSDGNLLPAYELPARRPIAAPLRIDEQ